MEMWSSIVLFVLLCGTVVRGYGISSKYDNATVYSYSQCGEGWYYSLDLNECYYISSNYLNFNDAVASCNAVSSQLVSVYSEVEYLVVSAHIQEQTFAGDTPAWIGLQADANSNYYWPDRSYANYTHWINGSANFNAYTDSCFAWFSTAANNGWWIYDCQAELPFICKRNAYLNQVNITANSGSITSPNYPLPYFSNSITNYYITVDPGYLIDLSFNIIAFDENSVVYVYDGTDTNSSLLETIRKGSHRSMIESNSNQIALEFVASADGGGNYIGWTAQFNASVPVTTSGGFTSPNFPNNYGINETVYHNIRAPENFGIFITIWSFVSEAAYDFLYLTNSCETYTFAGTYSDIISINLTCNAVDLKWVSDYSNCYRGFNLTWVAKLIA
uniref:C-type lectin domain-containing protein n=1 Tax=Panagrellus redivivus TaxID=6233 RepID=A0A7E4ZUY4_PANRE